jgi:hypothetical protein
LEHKIEENGKVLISLLGTVPDGVKSKNMTASRAKNGDGPVEM